MAILLDLSADDDLAGFRRALEEDRLELDTPALWYGRWGKTMGFELRTPLMIAAMYGSIKVLEYILAFGKVDVNRACGSDRATALHCAAAGGSPAAAEATRLLVNASANIEAVNYEGNKPGDIIPKFIPKARSLKNLLGTEETKREKEKEKEYPTDATLPDIKNGMYGTDDFRMYAFKVKPCSRAYSHDWTECPFAHPGENARRRDPRKYHYSCVPCPEFRKGSCRSGDACEYAHGVFESWLHPAQYRTRLCKDETSCGRRVCFFAHKPEELRQPGHLSPPRSPPIPVMGSRLKTSMSCRNMEVDLDLMCMEAYRQRQLDNVAAMSPESLNFSLRQYQAPSAGFQSLATTILKSKAAAFAKRSQSFCDRGVGGLPPARAPVARPVVSDWASPDGKLDWGVRSEELSELRRCESFGPRDNAAAEEPDVSWVHSLVKDGGVEHRGYEVADAFSSWKDQEQMVA